ncbi:MAG: chloride channel protein [Gemmatimonadaceae bacterium]
MRHWDRWLAAKVERLGIDENAVLVTFSVVVGLLSAIGVVAFYRAVDASYHIFYQWPTSFLPPVPRVLYRPVLTGIALTIAWAVWRRVGRGKDGLTVPDVQLAVVRRSSVVDGRLALGRTAASAITIGGGGSAGSEGPIAVLGAAVGSVLGRLFRFSPERMQVLVGAGTASAIAAAFNAPLAGAFFALEEIIGTFKLSSFAPVVVASVVGAIVSRAMLGNHPAFPIPQEYGYTSLAEVALFSPLLGAACGAAAALFVRMHFGIGAYLARFLEPAVAGGEAPRYAWLVPSLAGVAVGGVVALSGGALVGTGHLSIPIETFGRTAWWILLLLAMAKIVITSLTLQGGGSGGLFTPSLYVGAALGGSLGVLLRTLLPGLNIAPESYSLIGMGAVVAATTGAPITAILLVFEMTNDYVIVPPLMIAVAISHVVARRIERDNLYSGWLRRRGEHIEHGADRDVLASLSVEEAYERFPVVVREGEPVADLLQHLGHRDQNTFPVVGANDELVGVISASDLGLVARADHALDELLLAGDIAQPSETVTPRDSLREAVRRMGVRGVSTLPVVRTDDGGTPILLGIIHRGSVLALYERRVAAAPRAAAPPAPPDTKR